MTSGDLSVAGVQSYITSTVNNPANPTSSYSIQATFTPNYTFTYTGGGTQVDVPILTLKTTGGNDDIFTLDLQFNTYVNSSRVMASSGIEYGASTTGSTTYSSGGGITGLSGTTFLLSDTLTYSNNLSAATATVSNFGTLTEGGNLVYTFNYSSTGPVYNGDSFEPSTNPLTLNFGIINSSLPANFLGSTSDVTFSNISVAAAVPEPSTYAMLGLGLLVIAFAAKRRQSA
jgi:hypothetical protein